MAQCHLEENGISVRLNEAVLRFEGTDKVERVITDKGIIDADMVIMAVGVIPNSKLAKEAGLKVSAGGAIVVNERMETSDPHIFAGGDLRRDPQLAHWENPGFFPPVPLRTDKDGLSVRIWREETLNSRGLSEPSF